MTAQTEYPTLSMGPYVVGEVPGSHQHTFLDDEGNPIDITGLYIAFVFSPTNWNTLVVTTTEQAAGVVVDGPAGEADVTFTRDSFDVAGYYIGRFWAFDTPLFVNRGFAIASPLYAFQVFADPLGSPV